MDRNDLFDKALAYEKDYDYYKAVFYYEEIENITDKEYIRIANCYFKVEEYSKAIEYLNKVKNDNEESLYLKGCIENYYNKDIDKALVLLDKSIKLNPNFINSIMTKIDIIANNDNDKIDEVIKIINEFENQDVLSFDNKSSIIIKMLGYMNKFNMHTSVISYIKENTDKISNKHQEEKLHILSNAYFKLKLYNEAILCLDQLIKLNDEDDEAYYMKGYIYFIQEKYEESKILVETAVKHNPYNSEAIKLKELLNERIGTINQQSNLTNGFGFI